MSRIAAVELFALLSLSTLASAQPYSIEVFLPEGWQETGIHGLNDAGDMVGYGVTAGQWALYPLVIEGGQERVLDLPNDQEHRDGAVLLGINGDHKIVWQEIPTGKGFLFHNGKETLIMHPKAEATSPEDVINRKTDTLIVGSYRWVNGGFVTETAFILTKAKGKNDVWGHIRIPGAIISKAYGVSGKNGTMVSGTYWDKDWVSHGFLWNVTSKTLKTIDYPGACGTEVRGMNDSGHMVGWYWPCGNGPRAQGFMFDGQSYHPIQVEGAYHVLPEDINNGGLVVGNIEIQQFPYRLRSST